MDVLTDPNSPLANCNLRALVLDPEVWKLLTPEQIARVKSFWPEGEFPEDLSDLANNDHLRHDIAQYQKALADGQHDAEWIRQAQAASKLRVERYEADKADAGKLKNLNGGNGDELNGKASSTEAGEAQHGKKDTEVGEGEATKAPGEPDDGNGDHTMRDA